MGVRLSAAGGTTAEVVSGPALSGASPDVLRTPPCPLWGKIALMSRSIVSVHVATPSVLLHWPSGDVVSAIDKQPVDAPTLALSRLNLEGDEQADQRPTPSGEPVHGGVHQAVYAYPSEHYPRLTELMGRPLPWGFMGENLTLSGAIEDDV